MIQKSNLNLKISKNFSFKSKARFSNRLIRILTHDVTSQRKEVFKKLFGDTGDVFLALEKNVAVGSNHALFLTL